VNNLDREDELYFQELIREYKQNVKEIEQVIKRIWAETVEDYVYSQIDLQYYADGTRERTYQLRDMVTSKIVGDVLYVYADTNNMNYYSFGRRTHPVSAEDVVAWVNDGHHQSGYEGTNDNFRDYEGRKFLDKFYQRVCEKYPQYEIELIEDNEFM
jgi:hypothetical protein